jgi:hypothetical protein
VSPEEILLAALGVVVTLFGSILVFRRGADDSIDRKRESEIERLDKRINETQAELQETKNDLADVKVDGRIVASLAIRAVRWIEDHSDTTFAVSNEEREALERTRPAV